MISDREAPGWASVGYPGAVLASNGGEHGRHTRPLLGREREISRLAFFLDHRNLSTVQCLRCRRGTMAAADQQVVPRGQLDGMRVSLHPQRASSHRSLGCSRRRIRPGVGGYSVPAGRPRFVYTIRRA